MNRRDFVKFGAGSLITAPFIFNGYSPVYADNYASRIVSVIDELATNITYQAGTKINSDGVIVDKILSSDVVHSRVAKMVDTAVMKIADAPSVGRAWESFFPAGHPNSTTKIGIKINLSYGDYKNDIENDWSKIHCPFGPKSAITNAIVSGLSQMLDGTFPPENITLVERMYSSGSRKYYPIIQGFRPVYEDDQGLFKDEPEGGYGLHWIYATNPLELPEDGPRFIAAPSFTGKYQAPQRIYSAIYKNDFLINYAIGKDHRAAGITGVMKNNYGCTDNPMGTHGTTEWKSDDSPYAGTRLCVPVFHKNVNQQAPYILNVLDALTGVYDGGPLSGKVFHANTIAVSKDPVAIDSYLLDMINNARIENGISPLDTADGRTPERHPNASFLRIASENHELGSMSQENVQSYNISSNTGQYSLPTLQKSQSLTSEVRPNKDGYEVQVFLDNSKRNHTIEARIQNMRGKVIKSFSSLATRSSVATLQWDRKDDTNKAVSGGVYIWFISVDGILHTSTINDIFNS